MSGARVSASMTAGIVSTVAIPSLRVSGLYWFVGPTPGAQPRAASAARAARRLQRLVRRRLRLYIERMNVAFELPDAQAEKLRREAERLGVSPMDLARAALADLLADPDEAFQAASDRVLRKNEELYRRLA